MTRDLRINYVEFPVRDLPATKKFLGGAFGWSFVDYGDDYASFENAGIDGGLRAEQGAPPKGVLIVLYAKQLEAARDLVVEHGGKISVDIFPFPGGRRFHFVEPSGNELAVWSDQEA